MGRKVKPILWGNSMDQSTCGIVLVEKDGTKRLFFGSRQHHTDEDSDAEYIADWGDEIRESDLRVLLDMLGKLVKGE